MTNGKLFEARLTDESISALRLALGIPIFQVLSSALTVEGKFISSGNFSLHLDIQKYLILESVWLETPVEMIDYWQFSITFSETPKEVKLAPLENGGYVIDYPASTVIFQRPASPIVEISVHEASWSDDSCKESVIFDYAVVFYREDGKRFSFNVDDSFANQLYCTENESDIDSIVENHKCRLVIS